VPSSRVDISPALLTQQLFERGHDGGISNSHVLPGQLLTHFYAGLDVTQAGMWKRRLVRKTVGSHHDGCGNSVHLRNISLPSLLRDTQTDPTLDAVKRPFFDSSLTRCRSSTPTSILDDLVVTRQLGGEV
jgi:hypothetical protein